MSEEQVLRRGEIYWINLDNAIGQDTSKMRPCVVIQNDCDNQKRAVTIIAAITNSSAMKSFPYAVRLKTEVAGFPGDHFVNCGHIYTISKFHLQQKIGRLSSEEIRDVEKAIIYCLGITAPECKST
jgi:mRNA interferase MazF